MSTETVNILPLLYAADWTFCRRDLEDAFRALVGWPNEARVWCLDAGERQDLLGAVCRSLIDMEDNSTMPRHIFDLILDEAECMDGGTYVDGARVVRDIPKFLFNLRQEQPA